MSKKRGQITIFIVVGIILLFSTSLILFIKSEIKSKQISTDTEPVVQEVPSKLIPVKNYVESCLKKVAIDGLSVLGEHGGYIDVQSDYIKSKAKLNLKEKANDPTESDFVRFGGMTSDWKLPYWSYMESKNDLSEGCVFGSKQPPLRRYFETTVKKEASIELQLDDYLNSNVKDCLKNFETLEQQGFEIKAGNANVETTIAEHEVRFLMELPLEINVGDEKSEIKDFYVKIPLELKRMYELATTIAKAQANITFLERHALELIEVFSAVDSKKLPPVDELELKFGGGTVWSRTVVKKNLELMLMAWVRGLQVKGSKNFIDRSHEFKSIERIYSNMILPIEGYNDFNVRFDYLSAWPIYFNVNSNGDIIQPQSGSNKFLPFMGIQRYDTVYDLSFPAYVEIEQPPTLEFKDGYKFSFFLEANIRNGEAFKCGAEVLKAPSIPLGSLFCEPNQRNSGDITVSVVDDKTLKPVPDVEVGFTVADESCSVGRTGSDGKLTTQFPVGYGGIITFLKQDYFSRPVEVDIGLDDSFIVPTVKLKPYVTMKVQLKKMDLDTNLQVSGAATKLDTDEFAMVTLTRIKENPIEEDVMAVVEYREGEEAELRLVPGKYDIDINLMKEEEVIIPEDKRTAGSWPFEQKYTIPEVTLPDPHLSGGLNWKEFNINPVPDTMTFKILSFPTPTRMEDMSQISRVEEISNFPVNKLMLWPR